MQSDLVIKYITLNANRCSAFFVGILIGFSGQIFADPLPVLHVDKSKITVSGLSGGAFASMQMLVAGSDIFAGAGSVAGGIPGCPQNGGVATAQTTCMNFPATEDVFNLLALYRPLESRGEIPPLSLLQNKFVYIYNGSKDTTVKPESGQKLQQWAEKLMPSQSITTEFSVASQHGFPTLSSGNSCDVGASPWIVSCNYDGAGVLLKALHAVSQPKGSFQNSHLTTFDQSPYLTDNAGMATQGYIYIPALCHTQSCGLHVVLHGCAQSPEFVQTKFVTEAGYNEWAESNNLVVLYPSVRKSQSNPYACWDWWGYTGEGYLTRKAPQTSAVLKMVEKLSE